MDGSHIRTRRVHHSPGGTWHAENNISIKNKHKQTDRKTHIPLPPVTLCTFGAVTANALPDDELPLPQHSPDQVPWATADLDYLPGEGHLLPQRAFRIVVIDPLSEPHLDEHKRRELDHVYIAKQSNRRGKKAICTRQCSYTDVTRLWVCDLAVGINKVNK